MDDVVIRVDKVGKVFKLPHEKHSSVKSHVVNFYRKHRGYELQQALDDVSFEIKRGEFFGIVGRNGSGKSTLLKLLAGIYKPTNGGIAVNGTIVPFIELGVGFNPELTGRENVYLNGALLGFNHKEMDAMYHDIVSFAELSKFMDQKLKNYSSGMQVRLAFSIAIRARGDILLLDEVLAVGDVAFQQKCFDYFEELRRERKTVVFVSHDMDAIRRFCDRAVVLENGKVEFIGTSIDAADIYAIENIKTSDASQPKSTGSHKIKAEIVEQTETQLTLKVDYASKSREPMYLGIAILKDGISIAEINTLPDIILKSPTTITYKLDKSVLNGGTYQLGVALLRLKNKQEINPAETRCNFVVKGSDPSRGAAIKLASTWEVLK